VSLALAASALPPEPSATPSAAPRAVRDTLIVTLGGQLERVLGTLTTFAQKWLLDPATLGVYTGLRPYLDNANRSSLGVSLGAVQEIPILRAAGREAEAARVANVAFTTNTLTCIAYAMLLCGWAWLRAPLVAGTPQAAEWTWGLVMMAALVPLKRYQDFLIVVLRAHQEFALTTELAIVDALISAILVVVGLWLAGLWGLIGAVGGLLAFNIAYLHWRHPLRFRYAWDGATVWRLMVVGLPIWANTAVFFAVLNLDRGLILWLVPDGDRAAGLYTIALAGTSWALDLAGRITLVLYPYLQTELGRSGDPSAVLRLASRSAEAQAAPLAAGSAVAYLVGPVFLGLVVPRYAEGLVALRPLLPGALLLALAWPARQVLITVGRPYRLFAATTLGLAVLAAAGSVGASRDGLAGVAGGVSAGYAAVYLATSASAFATALGPRGWFAHQGRLAATIGWYAIGALGAAHLPMPSGMGRWPEFALRCALLCAWGLPTLYLWGRRHHWGGLFGRVRWPRRQPS